MDLAKKVGASKVYCHSEVTYEEDLTEKRVAAALQTEDIQLKACWGSTLYSPDELPFKLVDMPATHGPFLDLLESTCSKILPIVSGCASACVTVVVMPWQLGQRTAQ